MGNYLTVFNQTSNIIYIEITSPGSKKMLLKENVDANLSKQIHFSVLFSPSNTIIITVNDRATRAVSIKSSIIITESTEGQLQIIKSCTRYEIESSLNQIIENKERDMNWNLLADNNVKKEYKTAGNNVINLTNELITYLGYMVGNVKVVPNMNILLKFMKISNLELHNEITEFSGLFKKIKCQLIAISRTLEIDYQYIKNRKSGDFSFQFLHGQLMKITNTDILPSLETSDSEEALALYISAIYLSVKIFYEMRELDSTKISKLENEYILLFQDNLKLIWENVLDMIAKESKIKTTGFLIKTSYLRYRNQHIYKMKSICKDLVENRMNDVRNAFIKNRQYQTDFLYNNPNNVIKMLEKITVEFNNLN